MTGKAVRSDGSLLVKAGKFVPGRTSACLLCLGNEVVCIRSRLCRGGD